MVFCTKCGTENLDTDNYCSNCGNHLRNGVHVKKDVVNYNSSDYCNNSTHENEISPKTHVSNNAEDFQYDYINIFLSLLVGIICGGLIAAIFNYMNLVVWGSVLSLDTAGFVTLYFIKLEQFRDLSSGAFKFLFYLFAILPAVILGVIIILFEEMSGAHYKDLTHALMNVITLGVLFGSIGGTIGMGLKYLIFPKDCS